MLSKSDMKPIQPEAAAFKTPDICTVVLLILLFMRRRLLRKYICL